MKHIESENTVSILPTRNICECISVDRENPHVIKIVNPATDFSITLELPTQISLPLTEFQRTRIEDTLSGFITLLFSLHDNRSALENTGYDISDAYLIVGIKCSEAADLIAQIASNEQTSPFGAS